jgi:phosphatidylserine synthase
LMVSSIPYMKVRGKEKTLPLTIIFVIPILSYFLQKDYISALASPLLLIMMLYIISPIFIKNKENIHERKKQHN